MLHTKSNEYHFNCNHEHTLHIFLIKLLCTSSIKSYCMTTTRVRKELNMIILEI